MRAGRTRATGGGWPAVLAVALAAGCSGTRGLHQTLLADRNPAAHARDLDAHYHVHHPDVLALHVEGRPDCSGPRPVGLDGRIHLAGPAHLVVDGQSAPAIARDVARRLRLPPSAVRVEVQEYGSQFLYLFGEVGDRHHVVPYRGPETVLDLLQRIGGAAPGAALGDVRVVRAHVADGKPPEVFHVDLDAILRARDLQTNVRLEPFDRIHVGQTRTSQMACHAPPWLRWLCGKEGQAGPP